MGNCLGPNAWLNTGVVCLSSGLGPCAAMHGYAPYAAEE